MCTALVGLAAVLATAAGLERVCEIVDARRFPAPGTLVRVGPRRLYVQCVGRGQPVTVLEAGLNDDSTVWDKVYPGLAAMGRTCRYDRAGLGWSSAEGSLNSPAEAVADLDAVLLATHSSGPFILVGHSFGGLLIRLFAARYRGDVGGMVLVDSAHEDQFRRPYSLPNEVAGWRTNPTPLLATFGILRIGDVFNRNAGRDGPVERALRLRADRYWTLRATSRNMSAFEAAARQAPPLGKLPLAVVTATAKPAKFLPAWNALQDRLASQSLCSIHFYSAKSHHYVQKDDPALVLKAAEWVRSKSLGGQGCFVTPDYRQSAPIHP